MSESELFLPLKEDEKNTTNRTKVWYITPWITLLCILILPLFYMQRDLLTFVLEESNGQILINGGKGPTIYVKQNQTISVNVVNKLATKTSIHFHGITLPQDMDGLRTIEPGRSFRYSFKIVDSPGTYWWHAHDIRRTQGLYGAFVIGEDDAEIVMLGDISERGTHSHAQNLTVNGVIHDLQTDLKVKQDRLRLINVAASASIAVFFDTESQVIAADGTDILPIATSSLLIAPGQRYDVETDSRDIRVQVEQHMHKLQTSLHPSHLLVNDFINDAFEYAVATIANDTIKVDHKNKLMLIVNEEDHAHPIHVHGHKFHVIAADDYFYDITTGGQASRNFNPAIVLSLRKSTLRDTVNVNGKGWTLISLELRPGSWLLHCHDIWHFLDGLYTFL